MIVPLRISNKHSIDHDISLIMSSHFHLLSLIYLPYSYYLRLIAFRRWLYFFTLHHYPIQHCELKIFIPSNLLPIFSLELRIFRIVFFFYLWRWSESGLRSWLSLFCKLGLNRSSFRISSEWPFWRRSLTSRGHNAWLHSCALLISAWRRPREHFLSQSRWRWSSDRFLDLNRTIFLLLLFFSLKSK